MRYFFFIIIIFTIVSCKNGTLDKNFSRINTIDEILFYRISEKSELSLVNETTKLKDRESIKSLLYNNDSDNLIDSLKILDLDRYYRRITVDSKSFSQIVQVFEKAGYPINTASFSLTVCEPVYRDILVFKKSNEKIGFAKICFDCSQNKILIADDQFVNSKLQYEDLENILNNLANR